MHLSDDAFSKNENKTMIGKNGNIIVPGVELTNYDVREINLLYECSANLEKRGIQKIFYFLKFMVIYFI